MYLKWSCKSTYPPYLFAILISSSTLAAAAVLFFFSYRGRSRFVWICRSRPAGLTDSALGGALLSPVASDQSSWLPGLGFYIATKSMNRFFCGETAHFWRHLWGFVVLKAIWWVDMLMNVSTWKRTLSRYASGRCGSDEGLHLHWIVGSGLPSLRTPVFVCVGLCAFATFLYQKTLIKELEVFYSCGWNPASFTEPFEIRKAPPLNLLKKILR